MKYKTKCYNCGQFVDQVIKAVSQQAQVVCSNCGATRIFIPRIETKAEKGMFTPIGCYDVWELTTDAPCKNCGVFGPHDVIVGCNHFTTRCHNCDYAHFYKFDVEYIGQCPIEEEDES